MKLNPRNTQFNHKFTFKVREGKIQAPETTLIEDVRSQRLTEPRTLMYEKLMRLNAEITERVRGAAALDQTNDLAPDAGVVKVRGDNPLKLKGNLTFDPAQLAPEPAADDGFAVLEGVESGRLTVPDGERRSQVLDIRKEKKRGIFQSRNTTIYEIHDHRLGSPTLVRPMLLGSMYRPPGEGRSYLTDKIVVDHYKSTITYFTDELSEKPCFAPEPAVFGDNLPASVESGPSIKKLRVALETLESDILSGSNLSIEHPYGDGNRTALLEKIRGLNNSAGAVSQCWEKNRGTESGELSISQLAKVFSDQSSDLDEEAALLRQTLEESERKLVQELKRDARREYWQDVGKKTGTLLIQGAMTIAGAAMGTMAGPPGMIMGALVLGTLSMAVTIPSDFGYVQFEQSPERFKERPFDESRVESLVRKREQFSNLAEDASRWAGLLSSTET
jgi:hypothetical protein